MRTILDILRLRLNAGLSERTTVRSLGVSRTEVVLLTEVNALAGPRYACGDARPEVVRWSAQHGSIFLADQQLPITVPHVRNRAAQCEVPLTTYLALQTPRAQDVGLFRKVLGGLSCREYEAAAEAVPEAFGLAKSSVSRRFIRASAQELWRLQERRLDDAAWLVLVPGATQPMAQTRERGELLGPAGPTEMAVKDRGRVCASHLWRREARARATRTGAAGRERIRSRESRQRTGGDAYLAPVERLRRARRESSDDEHDRERDGAARGQKTPRDALEDE